MDVFSSTDAASTKVSLIRPADRRMVFLVNDFSNILMHLTAFRGFVHDNNVKPVVVFKTNMPDPIEKTLLISFFSVGCLTCNEVS